MAQEVLSSLVFEIASNTAELTRGLQEAKGKISTFSKGISEVGNLIKGAFAATAIIGAAKQVFNFSQQIGEARDKVRSLGLEGKELVDATAKARSISETFNLDFDKLLESARAVSKEFGISVPAALDKIRDGYAQTGSEEFVEILREYPAQFAAVGASADEAFALVSQSINEGIYSDKGADAIKEAGLRIREMTPATQDALKSIGISSDSILAGIENGTMTTFDAIKLVSQKLSGFKDDSWQTGQVLADVFGGAGEDAGIRFIKMIGQANQSFDEMTAGVNETVKAQLQLSKANEELNQIWVELFGGSSTWWTKLKADLIDIAVVALRAIKKGTIDVINYFITLYNESIYFRLIVQQVVFWFKELWTIVKLVGKDIIEIFSSAGKLMKAVMKGEFKDIPEIYKDAISKVANNAVDFGKETAENFREGIDAILEKEPIQLISEEAVTAQAVQAAKTSIDAFKAINSGLTPDWLLDDKGKFKMMVNPKKDKLKKDEVDIVTPPQIDDNKIRKLIDSIGQINLHLAKTKTLWEEIGESINDTIGVTAANAIGSFGEAIVGMNEETKVSFKDLVSSMLDGIRQILVAKLAQAIGSLLADGATKGLPGLLLATAGIGILTALWKSKVPAFANGGIVGGSAVQLVGEKGAELVSMPQGSRVFNHSDTMRMLNKTGNRLGKLEAIVTGEQIKFVLAETERRRI